MYKGLRKTARAVLPEFMASEIIPAALRDILVWDVNTALVGTSIGLYRLDIPSMRLTKINDYSIPVGRNLLRTNAGNLLFGTGDGEIRRSEDMGRTSTAVFTFKDTGQMTIAQRRNGFGDDDDPIFAIIRSSYNVDLRLMRSDDDGKTWVQHDELSDAYPPDGHLHTLHYCDFQDALYVEGGDAAYPLLRYRYDNDFARETPIDRIYDVTSMTSTPTRRVFGGHRGNVVATEDDSLVFPLNFNRRDSNWNGLWYDRKRGMLYHCVQEYEKELWASPNEGDSWGIVPLPMSMRPEVVRATDDGWLLVGLSAGGNPGVGKYSCVVRIPVPKPSDLIYPPEEIMPLTPGDVVFPHENVSISADMATPMRDLTPYEEVEAVIAWGGPASTIRFEVAMSKYTGEIWTLETFPYGAFRRNCAHVILPRELPYGIKYRFMRLRVESAGDNSSVRVNLKCKRRRDDSPKVVYEVAKGKATESISNHTEDCPIYAYGFNRLVFVCVVTSVGGTSPTLDLAIRAWDDLSETWRTQDSFPTIDSTGTYELEVPVRARKYALRWTLGGTDPSFEFSVSVYKIRD